jgi:hypothetical protein
VAIKEEYEKYDRKKDRLLSEKSGKRLNNV